ncbi:MAG: hypothetical protein ACREH3_04070 [Geminicoccales bacterium]
MLLLVMPFRMSGIEACSSILEGETVGIDRRLPPIPFLPVHERDVRALIAELARRQLVVTVPVEWPDLPDRSAPAAEAPGDACTLPRAR